MKLQNWRKSENWLPVGLCRVCFFMPYLVARYKTRKTTVFSKRLNLRLKFFWSSALFLFALVFCVSCRTTNYLPPADFSAPGWCVQQGQAIWKPAKNRPELVGDLLLATNADGSFFIQFSKNPFPLATAQISGDRWQIEFGADEHTWRGRGATPERFVWFQLPRALMAENVSSNWKFEHVATNVWRLTNSRTGETLEGQFFP
jgi:hypothetical protein